MTQLPLWPDLIDAAVQGGERAVIDDPRYPLPGHARAAFWAAVMARSLSR